MGWPTRFPLSRKYKFVVQTALVCLLAGSLIYSLAGHETAPLWRPRLGGLSSEGSGKSTAKEAGAKSSEYPAHRAPQPADDRSSAIAPIESSNATIITATSGLPTGNATLLRMAPKYIEAIMDPGNTSIDILSCPALQGSRYAYLQKSSSWNIFPQASKKWKYYFALDLTNCKDTLPRLLGSIVQAINFLGPEKCVLSIVEGNSNDGTYEVLLSLREALEEAGIQYYLNSSDINPKVGHRIAGLAKLRNLVLQPLFDNAGNTASSGTTIVFINDVSLCMEDILELIHQRQKQKADMICAMDWVYLGDNPTFYDVWIARGMNGDTFFEIPPDGSWDKAWNIFWNNPEANMAYKMGQPFQVYSCWNGALAFTAKPFLMSNVRFRAEHRGECPQGEPKSLCKDFWLNGYGKIAVVPSVNLEYSDGNAKRLKVEKGYVSDWVEKGLDETMIDWQSKPPEKVKCMPNGTYAHQTWPDWNAPKVARKRTRDLFTSLLDAEQRDIFEQPPRFGRPGIAR
ncbi:MAG: hypothetical protein Q9184_000696 [Pyrenodesmia sp. 2 TL-2023]